MPGSLGRYQPIRALGSGASSLVQLAFDRETGAEVVLKRVHAALATDERFASRFRREARILATLDHPRVLRLLDHGVDEDRFWFVYPHIPGASLLQVLRDRRRLEVTPALVLAEDVLEGLAYVHGLGIIHRDLKPANLLVTPQGRALILDFGLARGLVVTTVLTRTGELVGTPNYAAPGQIRGEDQDVRNDLYALGLILYEMLAGTNPLCSPDLSEALRLQLHVVPPPLHEAVPGVPRPLGLLVGRLLAKNLEDRPGSAGAVLERLRELAVPPPADDRPPGPSPPPGPATAPLPPQPAAGPIVPRAPAARPEPGPPGPGIRPGSLLAAVGILAAGSLLVRLPGGEAPGPPAAPVRVAPPVDRVRAWRAFKASWQAALPPSQRSKGGAMHAAPPPERLRQDVLDHLDWWLEARTPLRVARVLADLAAWIDAVEAGPFDAKVAERILLAGTRELVPLLAGVAGIEAHLTRESLAFEGPRSPLAPPVAGRMGAWHLLWTEVVRAVELHCAGLPRSQGAYAPQLAAHEAQLLAVVQSTRLATALDVLARAVEARPAPDRDPVDTAWALAFGCEMVVSRLARTRALRSDDCGRAVDALVAYDGVAGREAGSEARTGRLLALLASAAWGTEAWERDRRRDCTATVRELCVRIDREPDLDPASSLDRLDFLLRAPASGPPGLGILPPSLPAGITARLVALRASVAARQPPAPPGPPGDRPEGGAPGGEEPER